MTTDRIVNAVLDEENTPVYISARGRMWAEGLNGWTEYYKYPPGCDPIDYDRIVQFQITPDGGAIYALTAEGRLIRSGGADEWAEVRLPAAYSNTRED